MLKITLLFNHNNTDSDGMIYLDNHATTPCDIDVLECMLPYFSIAYGNSSSNHHFGELAAQAVDNASAQVANLIGASPDEISFTSGATESNNMAILGIAGRHKQLGLKRNKLITTIIEHKSVLSPIMELSKAGFEVVHLSLDNCGRIDLDLARNIIAEDALLVSVQLANSEIGTIQPIEELAKIAHQWGVMIHCDASQAVGKVSLNVLDLDIDLLSLSGHKIYGPKGIGSLWLKHGIEKLINPIMFGGESVNNLRPGTLPIPLIVGLGKACELVSENLHEEISRITELRNLFESLLTDKIVELSINGSIDNRLPNNSNMTFPCVDAESLLANLPEIIASTGSACESGSIEPSRVLLGIGLSREEAYNSIRFGFGRYNTKAEVEIAAEEVVRTYHRLLN